MSGPVSLVALRSLPIFEALSDARLAPITKVATLRQVPRNLEVLRAGDHTDNVYFVLTGALKVLVGDDDGREVILSMLGPGDFFGEMGVIDDHPRSATVATVETSSLIVLTRSDFERCLTDNVDVSLYIMRSLVQRLRKADRNIESLALLDVYGRVARLLLDMAEVRDDGKRVVTQKITKQDIARMVGASREMVSRVMRDLQLQGLIEETDGVIILHGDMGDSTPAA